MSSVPRPSPLPRSALLALVCMLLLGSTAPTALHAQASGATLAASTASTAGDDVIVQARDAFRRKDRIALASARMAANAQRHPLAMWVEYWELNNRLGEALQPELDTFYARWPGSYVEDRLRNDWLLELGKRRDWAKLRVEFPRFRMNDDREVTCYALLADHLAGQEVRAAGRAAWLAQREPDDGCTLLARTLFDAKQLSADDAWAAARQAAEFNRPRLARAAAALVNAGNDKAVADIWDNPVRWLERRSAFGTYPAASRGAELEVLALMRIAAADPDYAAAQLDGAWAERLPAATTATLWAHTGKQAALKHLPQATDYARKAWRLWDSAKDSTHKTGLQPPWSDDLVAWHVRAALRRPTSDAQRWPLVLRAIDAMPASEQRDPAWVYWKARATQALAKPGVDGDVARADAAAALESIAPSFSFYGKLATEDLGRQQPLPPSPLALSAAERDAARANAGLVRALRLIDMGLRNEGVREWNFSLRGMADRDLLAAAQWACEREVWDRCINTSERTRNEIDVAQRFPLPWRGQMLARARDAGLDPAVLYGLIRQESRFVGDARSGVGAQGLMQVMPATAAWTAKKIGLPYNPAQIADRDVNLQIGSAYLKRVLDDFGGSLALAAAAYNAGPGRPRRWRESGTFIEPAAWAESIPFNETRDYVKRVLSNSVYYAALLGAPAPTLKGQLGAPIGPAVGTADRELP